MVLAEIGTAGVISAYFFKHITSGYSLNVSDPIEGQPVHLSDYPFVFGCGLVFWLSVLLRAKLHGSGDRQADIRKVAKLAKLITPITTLNLCGGLLAPFMKLPLLVRFLLPFQVSSNLALLLIWAFLSLKECMILLDAHTQQQQKSSPEPQAVHGSLRSLPKPGGGCCGNLSKSRGGYRGYLRFSGQIKRILPKFFSGTGSSTNYEGMPDYPLIGYSSADRQHNVPRAISAKKSNIYQTPIAMQARREGMPVVVHQDDVASGKIDWQQMLPANSGKNRYIAVQVVVGAGRREENRGKYGGNDGGGGAGGGGDRGASGSGHGSEASGSGENSGGYGGHGRDERGTGSEHGSGASGSGENSGSEGGDRDRDRGGGDLENGGRETKTEQAFKSSKITEMSLMLTAQTTATLIGYHLIPTPSSSSKALLVVALMNQLVGYLCGVTSILLSSNKPEDSKAAKIFANIGFGCSTLGFILMIAMYVAWYLVLIVVLLFGVVWVIFFRNGLKTRGTEVWNYLKNARNQ